MNDLAEALTTLDTALETLVVDALSADALRSASGAVTLADLPPHVPRLRSIGDHPTVFGCLRQRVLSASHKQLNRADAGGYHRSS